MRFLIFSGLSGAPQRSVKPCPGFDHCLFPPLLYKRTWDAAEQPCPPPVIGSLHFIAGEFTEEKNKISRKKTGVETKQSLSQWSLDTFSTFDQTQQQRIVTGLVFMLIRAETGRGWSDCDLSPWQQLTPMWTYVNYWFPCGNPSPKLEGRRYVAQTCTEFIRPIIYKELTKSLFYLDNDIMGK